MTRNIVDFPDRNAIENEAGAWLIKLDGETPLSTEEMAQLREWLGCSPAHREELQSLARFWGRANILTELAIPFNKPSRVKGRRYWADLRIPTFNLVPMVVGFAVLVLVIGTTLWLQPNFDSSNGHYSTAIGKQQPVTLSDGSVVLLNTNSRIAVAYQEQSRDIRLLTGEAHFTVVRDRGWPFRVYAGSGRIEAVGTAFAVHIKDRDVDVTVTEGSVEIAAINGFDPPVFGDNTLSGPVVDSEPMDVLGTLQTGQRTTIRLAAEVPGADTVDIISTVAPAEITRQLAWRDGQLAFSGEPLEQVVSEISRYTTVSVDIPDPEVRAIRIGGRIPVGETKAMFTSLETNFGLRITHVDQDHIQITIAED